MIKVKSLGLQTIATTIFGLSLIGCNGGGSDSASTPIDTTKEAQLVDSAIQGAEYTTNSLSGITDESGTFQYDITDTTITFKVGSLTLADFNLSNLNNDGKLLPADIFGVSRENTTDANLLKFLRVVQSLDNDNNPANGILIDDNTKGFLTTDINIKDANISQFKTIIASANKTLKLERASREHYKTTLTSMGISPQFAPFVTVWETTASNNNITIPTNPNYTYNYTIDWGDGTIENNITEDKSHIYTTDGNHTVKISGDFPAIYMQDFLGSSLLNSSKIQEITSWGDTEWKSMRHSFTGCLNLRLNTTDNPNLSNVTDMGYMFWNNLRLNQDMNDWNTSNITNMSHMFQYARNFNQAINNWDTSNVINMSNMFEEADNFNQNLNDWNTSNVIDMSGMFMLTSMTNQDLSRWNVNKVTNHNSFITYSGTGNILPPLFETLTHNGTTYGKIMSPYTGRIWLDRNLGASQICTKSRDAKDDNNNSVFADDAAYVASQKNCFGDYYQWGREFDGHQESNSTTTATLATDINVTTQQNIVDNNGSFITISSSPYDWVTSGVDNNGSIRSTNWSKTDGTSICPIGFRVPSITELRVETIDLTGTDNVGNRNDAFKSFLKLPSAGIRDFNGINNSLGNYIFLWSNSLVSVYSEYVYFYDTGAASNLRLWANGLPVRCIKN